MCVVCCVVCCLQVNKSLLSLDCTCCSLGAESGVLWAAVIGRNRSLHTLTLNGNEFGPIGGSALVATLGVKQCFLLLCGLKDWELF